MSLNEQDRRLRERTPSMLRGKIVFLDREKVFDCKIADLSEQGAKISVDGALLFPRDFILEIPLKGWRKPAMVKWRTESELGVSFDMDEKNHLADRVAALEDEIDALRRFLKLRPEPASNTF